MKKKKEEEQVKNEKVYKGLNLFAGVIVGMFVCITVYLIYNLSKLSGIEDLIRYIVMIALGLVSIFVVFRYFRFKKNAKIGKYIMFIDGDDYINIKGIEKIINYIQKNEFDLLLFNTIKYYEKTGKYEIEKYAINDYKNVSISDLIDNKICGRAWRFIYNKKMLDKNKLSFHKSLIYEDEEWVPQVIYYSKKIEYIDEDLYIYRKRNNSITVRRVTCEQ